MRFIKKAIVVAICLPMIFASANAATVTSGFFGISNYAGSSSGMQNRPGTQYNLNLNLALNNYLPQMGHPYTNSYRYEDSAVTLSRFKTQANSTTAQTIFTFAGHGLAGASRGPVLWDGTVSKSDLGFRHRYVTMYTCNFLTNNGQASEQTAIYNTFKGTRLMLGFGSQMYMDSSEGTEFGTRLESETVGSAFINAARRYQTQNSNAVVAKVVGHSDAGSDYIYSGKGAAPSYSSSNAGSFREYYNTTIYPV